MWSADGQLTTSKKLTYVHRNFNECMEVKEHRYFRRLYRKRKVHEDVFEDPENWETVFPEWNWRPGMSMVLVVVWQREYRVWRRIRRWCVSGYWRDKVNGRVVGETRKHYHCTLAARFFPSSVWLWREVLADNLPVFACVALHRCRPADGSWAYCLVLLLEENLGRIFHCTQTTTKPKTHNLFILSISFPSFHLCRIAVPLNVILVGNFEVAWTFPNPLTQQNSFS